MYRMEKITPGIAYGASGGGTGFWLLQLLDKVSPSQWAAIGVLGTRTVYVPAQCTPIPTDLTQPMIVPLPPAQ